MQNLTPYVTRNGDRYDIPPDREEAFKADFGEDAQPATSYRTKDGQSYNIPQSMDADFRKDFPDAQPVRRLSFAGGETRDFTADEMRKFFQDEYITSPKYKQDRDEDDARQKAADKAAADEAYAAEGKAESEKRLAEAAKAAGEAFDANEATRPPTPSEAASQGVEYVAKKEFMPWLRAFVTAPMRLMDKAAARGSKFGFPLGSTGILMPTEEIPEGAMKNLAANIERPFTPTKDEEEDVGSVVRGIGKVEETANTIGAFAAALHGLGKPVGIPLMSAEAGNDTYMSLFDTGVANGMTPEEANEWALGGGTIAALGTAAMGALSIPKFMQMGTPVLEEGVAMGGYRDLLQNALVGNIKRYLINTAGAAAWQGGIMGGQSALETIPQNAVQGKDTTWGEMWWNGAKSFAEGAGIGLFMGGLSFVDYRRGVTKGIEAEARRAAGNDTGRAMWAQMFPEGTGNLILKRAKGENISRADIERAGYPEMPQAQRNAVADALIEQFGPKAMEKMGERKAAEAAEAEAAAKNKAAAEASKPPYEEPAKPEKGEVVPVEKPAETPTEPKPTEPPPKPPAEKPVEAPVNAPPQEGTTTAPAPAEPPKAEEPAKSEAPAEVTSLAERRKELQAKFDANLDENGNPVDAETAHSLEKELDKIDVRLGEIEAQTPGTLPQDLKAVARMPKAEKPETVSASEPKPVNKGKKENLPKHQTDLPRDGEGAVGEIGERRTLANGAVFELVQAKNGRKKWTCVQSARWTVDYGKTYNDGVKRGDRFTDSQIDNYDGIGDHTMLPPDNGVAESYGKDDERVYEVVGFDNDGKRPVLQAVKKPAAPQGDAAQQLSAMSDEDIDKAFAAALGEKEAASGAPAPTSPAPTVNKGKGKIPAKTESAGTVPAAASEDPSAPKPTNKGKGVSPERRAEIKAKAKAKQDAAEQRMIARDFGAESDKSGNIENAVAALHNLFGASDFAKSKASGVQGMAAPSDNFDENVYNTARPHFQTLLDGVVKSGRGVNDFIKAVADNFGAGALPYLKRFAADMRKGASNGQQGSEGNRNGQLGGPDATDGSGASEAGSPAAAGQGGNGGIQPSDTRLDGGVPAGTLDGGGGGKGNGVPAANGRVAGDGTSGGGGGASSGSVGNGLVPKDAGTGNNAGGPPLVRAANGNIDTRNMPPVRLTPSQRRRINAEATELIKKPVGSLTDAELDVLRQFTGEGGLGFKDKSIEKKIAALNQHFTDYPVIDAMWNALEKAGVRLIDVCEPAAGNGNFPGRRPEKNWTLVELESTTAGILRHLFPGATVMPGTFEDVQLAPQDAFISNVPFVNARMRPIRSDVKSLHDFYFVHALSQTKPNGVVAFITSHGTMDKLSDAVRREIVENADVIGAFRLPENMFQANADTSVTTDIIFLQKRPDGVPARPENAADNEAFIGVSSTPAEDGNGSYDINKYYELHPENILGDIVKGKNKMYGGRAAYVVNMSDATDLSQVRVNYRPYPVSSSASKPTAGNASKGKYPHTINGLTEAGAKFVTNEGANGAYFSQNIRMYDGVPHVAVEEFTIEGYQEGTHKAKVFEPIEGEIGKKIRALEAIRGDADAFQRGDEKASARGQAEIEDYRKAFGVHPSEDRALKKFFKEHGEKGYLEQLSTYFDKDFAPTDVWKGQTRHEGSGQKQAKWNDPLPERAIASEDTQGRITFDKEGVKVEKDELPALLDSGYSVVDVSDGGTPVLQNDVLFRSGNIYAKIDAMNTLKREHPELAVQLDRQIAKLEEIKPTPRTFDQIRFSGVEGWIPPDRETGFLGEPGWAAKALEKVGIRVLRSVENGSPVFDVTCEDHNFLSQKDCELLGQYMTGRKLVNRKKEQSLESHLSELRNAEARVAELYSQIRATIDANDEARAIIERGANEKSNAYVAPDYTKLNHLSAPTVAKFKANGIQLRANQINWATKAYVEGRGLNAHDVGGGKTFGALALTDMLLEHGSAKKIIISVPKQTIGKWESDARKVMPDRKIMNAGSLTAKDRSKMLAQIANADTQIVFVTHEGFEAIDLSPEDETAALDQYISEVIEDTNNQQEGVKLLRMQGYRDQQAKRERETRYTFDKLGVDCVICDEAHNFKNVGVSSSLEALGTPVSISGGLDKETGVVRPFKIQSARSLDFRFKCDYVTGHNNGRNVFLLTATPTPNAPLEAWTMLRHMGRGILEEYGIFRDVDFARTFLETASREVEGANGRTAKTILVKIKKVYELRDMLNRFFDRIPMKYFAEKYNIQLPAVSERQVFMNASEGTRQIMDDLRRRADHLPSGWGRRPKGSDSMPAIYSDGLRMSASELAYEGPHAGVVIEQRTFDAEDDKIEWSANYATGIVRESNKEGGLPRNLLFFCDTMAAKRKARGGMSIHEELKQALVARGFKPSEVIIATGDMMTDPKTGNEVKATDDLKYRIAQAFSPEDKSVKMPTARVIVATRVFAEGINLQRFCFSIIDMDVPITHGLIQQRHGRGIRSGNEHPEIHIIQLFRRGSFDKLAYSVAMGKKGWNEALWDKAARDELDVSEEFSGGAIPEKKRVAIEMIEDPVEKIQRTVEYELEALRTRSVSQIGEVGKAKESLLKNGREIGQMREAADEHTVKAKKEERERARLENEVAPALRKKADEARDDFSQYAKDDGVPESSIAEIRDAIESLPSLRQAYTDAQNAVEYFKPGDYADKTPDERAKIFEGLMAERDATRKAFADRGKEATALVNALPESVKPFGRTYRKAIDDICQNLVSIDTSSDVIKKAERNAAASLARIPALEAATQKLQERVEIEEANLKNISDKYAALGKEWYDDFGTDHQQFKLEKATLQAEMEAANKAEDSDLSWVSDSQTLDAMPAPASTGTRPLNKGKLPKSDARLEATGTAKPKYTTSPSDIFRLARELFPEIKITNKGTYHRRGVLGWLEVENRVIRTIDPRGVTVLAHELGHAVSRLAENKVKMPRDARSEFISLGIDLYGSKRPAGGYAAEGFAEFVRGFLCDYDLAADYPNANKWFFEDFGGANPEFVERLFALKGKILEYVNMAPEQAIRSMWDHKRPMSASELPFVARARRYDWKTKWVDSNYPILRAMKNLSVDYDFHDKAKTPAERAELILNHPYMLATFFQGSALRFAEGDALTGTTDLYGDATGAGLQEILSPIVSHGREKLKEFWDFAVAMRGADYAKKGMEFGRTRNEIAAAIGKYRSPENRKALQDITDWSHRVLHLLVDAGAITPDEYQQIVDANPVYVPIRRVFEEGEIDRARQKAGKRAIFRRHGGTQDIEHPAVALVEMAAKVRAVAQQAKVVQSLVDMYDRARAAKAKDINNFMVEVPNPVKRQVVWANKIKEQIAAIAKARFGTDEATIRAALKDTWTDELSVFSTGKYRGKDNIVTITDRSGKLRSFEVFDPAILELLRGYGKPPEVTPAERAMQWLANGIRMGATVLKGSFSLVANPIRDTATAYHMSEYGHFVPVWSSIEGTLNSIFGTDMAKTYLRLGGDMGRFYNGGQHAAAKEIAGQMQAANWFVRQWKKGIFQLVGDVFSMPEIGPRLIAFRNAKNYWMAEGVGETAANMIGRLCGGDVTIDFGRAGTTARKANRKWLFLNAALRELDQLARASGLADSLPWQNPGEGGAANSRKNHAKRFWARGAALTAFAIAAYLLNNDNEKKLRRWRELKPEHKWNNTIFDLGDEDGTGATVRLPVPFLDGLMFQSLPVAIIEAVRTGEAKPVQEVLKIMGENLPYSPSIGGKGVYHSLRGFVPSAAVPITDLLANENFAGSEIVPARMERLAPEDQYGPNTTEFSKMMGSFFGVSPAKFEYSYDQYTGGLVSGVIRDIESSTSKRGAIGVNGDLSKIPIAGRIFLAPFSSSRLPGDFYGELQELTAKHNSGRVTPTELGKLKAMEGVNEKVLSENAKMRRAVLAREDISAEEAKKLADGYAKDTIDTIRTFNGYAKDHDFRAEGIRSAVSTLSNPGATDTSIQRDRKILQGVSLSEAQNALRVYGKSKGWSRDTINKRLRFLGRRWQ